MVVVVPVPVEVTAPGVLVSVHVPVAGNPLRTTLPVATAHDGCVIVPTVGASGHFAEAVLLSVFDFTVSVPYVVVA